MRYTALLDAIRPKYANYIYATTRPLSLNEQALILGSPTHKAARKEELATATSELENIRKSLAAMNERGELDFLSNAEHQVLAKMLTSPLDDIIDADLPLHQANHARQRARTQELEDFYWPAKLDTPKLGTVFQELEQGSGNYARVGEKKTAFVDNGEALIVRDKAVDTFQAVMKLARAKGWTAIELSGKPEQIARGWIEAQLLGIEVTNFAPNEQDVAALSARRAALAADKTTAVEEPTLKVAAATVEMVKGARVVTAGRHIGSVVEIAGQHVIQNSGQAKVAHKWGATDQLPAVGKILDIQYQHGRAVLRETKAQCRGGRS